MRYKTPPLVTFWPIRGRPLLLALALTLLSACGGGGGGGDGDDALGATPAPENPANQAPPEGPATSTPPAGHAHHCGMVPGFADASLMTRTATASGDWGNADTWNGTLPTDGDRVQIPEGVTVTLRSLASARLKTLRVDGALHFASDIDTELQVETLVSTCSGRIEIGTEAEPIAPAVRARVRFIDDGEITDTALLARGAILIGSTRIHGAAKTHRATLMPHARQGDARLQLATAPASWAVGDELIITGTLRNDPRSDEIRTIAAVSANEVTLDAPLDRDHRAPRPDLKVYVANTTRNVEFLSENPSIERRGHIMIMNADTDIRYARFSELGRTDKTRPLDDFQFLFPDDGAGDDAPATAALNPLFGRNIRGRYAIHFHQIGTDPNLAAARVSGSVVFRGPGWGFVNHSSHVDFVDNVTYGLQGAGFYTEAGDEIGTMRGNIAIRSVNDAFQLDFQGAIDPDLRAEFMDYGNDGDGYWLTGNRVSLVDNVAAGATAHGFIYWADGVMEPDAQAGTATRVTIPVERLPNGNLIPGRDRVPVWWAPLADSRGNEAYGATIGFRARYIHAKNYLGRDESSDFHRSPPQAYIETLTPTFRDLTVWGSRDGVLLNYNERVNLSGATIVGFGTSLSSFQVNDGTAKTGVGLDTGTDATFGPGRIEGVAISGFGAGFVTPVNGRWTVQDLALTDNGIDLYIQPEDTSPTEVALANVTFGTFADSEVDGVSTDRATLPEHIRIVVGD